MPDNNMAVLAEAKKLLMAFSMDALQKDWEALYKAVNQTAFSIMITGDHARGKSTMVNSLLRQEILPAGLGTAQIGAPVRVCYGAAPVMAILSQNGSREERPFSPVSWQAPLNAVSLVEIRLPDEWLQKFQAVFIEESLQEIAEASAGGLTPSAIYGQDIVVVVVSATMALSQREMGLIKMLKEAKIPRVAVALTHLDHVESSERSKLLVYVKSKLENAGHSIPFFITSPVEGSNQEIKRAIEGWLMDKTHRTLRTTCLTYQITAFMKIILSSLEAHKKRLEDSNARSSATLQQISGEIDMMRLLWRDLSLELAARMNACSNELQELGNNAKKRAIEMGKNYIAKTTSPKQTAEDELPAIIDEKRGQLMNELEMFVYKRTLADTQWLEGAVQAAFAKKMPAGATQKTPGIQPPESNMPARLKDYNRLRTVIRTAAGLLSVAGYIMLGPLALAASVGGGVISDLIIAENIKDQRESVTRWFLSNVNAVFEQTTNAVITRVVQFYEKTLEDLSRLEEEWGVAQQAFLTQKGVENMISTTEVEQAVADCNNIIEQLSKTEN